MSRWVWVLVRQMVAFECLNPYSKYPNAQKDQSERIGLFVVGEDGFASLRRSHGPANSPPDCLLGRPFRIRPQYKKSNTKWCWTFRGGGGRIRTIEAKRSRFTVCPLWPLGNSPICSCCLNGAGRRTRTPDLLITNQLLYQLSYTGGSNRTCLL